MSRKPEDRHRIWVPSRKRTLPLHQPPPRPENKHAQARKGRPANESLPPCKQTSPHQQQTTGGQRETHQALSPGHPHNPAAVRPLNARLAVPGKTEEQPPITPTQSQNPCRSTTGQQLVPHHQDDTDASTTRQRHQEHRITAATAEQHPQQRQEPAHERGREDDNEEGRQPEPDRRTTIWQAA